MSLVMLLARKRCSCSSSLTARLFLRGALLLLLLLLLASTMRVAQAVRVLPNEKQQQTAASESTTITSGGSSANTFQQQQQQHQQRRRLDEEQQPQSQQRQTAAAAKVVQVDIPDSPDGHLVTNMPLLKNPSDFTTRHWAGHLPASATGDKYFFYWLFEPAVAEGESTEQTDIPLLIWLNGGPGCSSMDGLFLENGPLRIIRNPQTGAYEFQPEAHSWHKLPAWTLYIDQPVGTGLSFTTSHKYPSNDAALNTDFHYFLQQFLQFHADKFVKTTTVEQQGNKQQQQLNRPLFFSGESYAGHYISIFVNHILKQNDNAKNKASGDAIHIPVTGAAIGNGWVDPYHQYAGAEAAYGHGLIGFSEVAALAEKEKQCQAKLAKGVYNSGICFSLIDDIVDESKGGRSGYKVSSYDIRRVERNGQARDFPPGHKIVETLLGGWPLRGNAAAGGTFPADITDQMLAALHATAAPAAGQRFQECTDPPYDALKDKDGQGVVQDIVETLEHADKVQLLFFNGIMDMVCNHVGNERLLEKLPWNHREDWNQAQRYAWTAEQEEPGQVSGYMREFENLMYLKIMNAGHMVPLDVPNVAFQMMRSFLYGNGFKESAQRLSRSLPTDECPVCPECPAGSGGGASSSSSSPANYPSAASGIGGIKWILFLFAFIGCIVAYATFRKPRRRQPYQSSSAANGGYGVELPESGYADGSYSDEPSEDADMNGGTTPTTTSQVL